ncbi:MAG: hypothetical protein JW818_23135 [Pirellulales bacterium]|nr:hypothetical protein [Pirellulales bacterium]
MNRQVLLGVTLLTLAMSWPASGRQGAMGDEVPKASAQQGAPSDTVKQAPFRAPARGVLEAVAPIRLEKEAFTRKDVTELVHADPGLDWAKDVIFARDIWNLKFECKVLRIVWVDMPQPSGKMQRKPIYYLVYCLTNVPLADQKEKPPRYGWMHPEVVDEKTGELTLEYKDGPIRPVLEFLLESPEHHKAYPDRVIPLAMTAIRQREDRKLPGWSKAPGTVVRNPLLDTVQIAKKEIAVGQTVWGVATWEEIDPRIDDFTIYVQGLTNAARWKDDKAAYKPGSPLTAYRKLALKTLKLNFWRPGDDLHIDEAEIRRGQPGKPDYEWVYLPSLSGMK